MSALPVRERADHAAAPPPPRPSRARAGAIRSWAIAVAYGALVGGGALSLVHVFHNRVDGVRDAAAIWIFFSVVAAVAAAATALPGILCSRLVAARHGSRAPRAAAATLRSDLAWGLGCFHVAYLVPFTLYGRTYDEAAFAGPPRTAAGMIAVLAMGGLLAASAGAALGVLVARAISALAARGRLRRLGIGATAALLSVHLAAPLVYGVLPQQQVRADAPFRPLRARDRGHDRVVLVGLDGADWRVLRPMVERGEAPAFARLMKEGAWGPLATLAGENSSALWASIYTGKPPRAHGVLDFYRIRLPGMSGPGIFPVHRTFFVQLADALGRRGLLSRRIADRSFLHTRPLWEILDDLGLSVGVVDGYHYSVPARPLQTPGGFFFSYALNALSQRPGWSPATLTSEQGSVLVQPPEAIDHYLPHAGLDDFDWQAATLLDLLDSGAQPDFVSLYSHQPDAIQHQRWKWLEPERFVGVDPADLERWGDSIPAAYRAFDRFLGELVPRLAPGTTLLVVSDHGHSPTLVDRLYTQHRHAPPGILLMWGAGVSPGVELRSAGIYDVTPTVLHLLGLPPATDMAGTPLREGLDTPTAGAGSRAIESYDAFAPAGFDSSGTPDLSAEELERLRNMGYL